ncbi:MAG: glycosyltransferase family 2 protein [Desulfovibrionales bacterium]|nr:MAG: glycosyltransferase family 2 protein [Desulfovibrionales bacterium]
MSLLHRIFRPRRKPTLTSADEISHSAASDSIQDSGSLSHHPGASEGVFKSGSETVSECVHEMVHLAHWTDVLPGEPHLLDASEATPVVQGQDELLGEIDGLAGPYLTGWVCRKSALDQQLWIEVRVDNTPLTVCRADQLHAQAKALGLGDGCYGFWLRLPDSVLSSESALSLHVANTGEPIGQPLQLDRIEDRKKAMGQVFSDGGPQVTGWLRDPEDDTAVLDVRCVLDGKEVGRARADQRRASPPEGDGHGFAVTLPFGLLDGKAHLVDVLDEQGRHLPGSPVQVHSLAQGASAWLENLSRPKPEQLKLLRAMLSRYENWFPKSAGLDMVDLWLKAYPPECPRMNAEKTVCAVLLPGEGQDQSLRGLLSQKYDRLRIWSPGHGDRTDKKLLQVAIDTPETIIGHLLEFDYLLLVEAGTVLEKFALANLVFGAASGKAGVLYCDGVLLEPGGRPLPRCKPAWDRFLFYGHDYLDGPLLLDARLLSRMSPELGVFAASVAADAQEAGTRYEQAYQRFRLHLLLIVAEDKDIKHLPVPLYHGPTISEEQEADRVRVRRDELQECFNRSELDLTAETDPTCLRVIRVRRPLRSSPLVSLIIPTRDRVDLLRPCISSILELTTYKPYDIIIVDNDSREPETAEYFRELRALGVTILPYPHPFNYAAMNNLAVSRAEGEICCFLNNDLELLTPEWLEEMLDLLLADSVGVVGAKLIWPNSLVQHGGVVTGVHQLAAHVGNDWLCDEPGYLYRNQIAGQWSAVTAACMLTWREDYLRIGGMDQINFPVTFNDVDYCLKLSQEGKKVLWTPHARFIHHESASRGKDDTPAKQAQAKREMYRLREQWGARLLNDPFYNPNLSLSTYVGVFNGLALPPGKRSVR